MTAERARRRRHGLKVFLFFCLLIIPFPVQAYTLAPKDISGETIWTKENGPYIIASDLIISATSSLSIEPGAGIAIANKPTIWIYGSLTAGGEGFRSVIDGVFELTDEYEDLAEYAEYTSPPKLYLQVFGSLHVENADINVPININSKRGSVRISRSNIEQPANFIFYDQSSVEVDESVFGGLEEVRVTDRSQVVINDSEITGGSKTIEHESIFHIFKNSRIDFNNSEIIPLFSSFALVTDGSKLQATSTLIRDMERHGIQADTGAMISLYDVTFDTSYHKSLSPAFLTLNSADGSVVNSLFLNSAYDGIQVYKSYYGKPANLLLKNSRIENYVRAGISAVRGFATVRDSVIRGGAIGVENVFATTSITDSVIADNSQFGVKASSPPFVVKAGNNFWGDASGPFNLETNPSGTGNQVTANVIYAPWLTAGPSPVCCSNVLFLPGIQGSRLYKGAKRIWEPLTDGVSELYMDEEGRSLSKDIVAKEIIDEAFAPLAGPDIYKSFIGMMNQTVSEGVINAWKAFAYDWRMDTWDIASSTEIMKDTVRLADESRTGKIAIVAHSYGGLLAKAIASKMADIGKANLIEKIIFVSVPQLGTPAAAGALLHGFGQGIPFILPAKEALALARNMPGAYALLPSGPYFRSVFDPTIRFREGGAGISDFSGFQDFLFAEDLNAVLVKRTERSHSVLDSWTPPIGMNVIQIAGWGMDTLSGLEYFNLKRRGRKTLQYKPVLVLDGDGTVVVPSALAISTSSPNVSRYWFNLGKYNSKRDRLKNSRLMNRRHGDIFEVEELREFIRKNIAGGESGTAYISTSSPESVKEGKRLRFTLYSPELRLDLYDSEGRHTGLSTSTPSTPGSADEFVPGSYFRKFGDVSSVGVSGEGTDGMLVIIKAEANEQGSFQEGNLALDVDLVSADSIISTVSYTDIPVKNDLTSFTMDVRTASTDDSRLDMDEDGDGQKEGYFAPGENIYKSDIIDEFKTTSSMNHTKEIESQNSQRFSGGRRRLKTDIKDIQILLDGLQFPEITPVKKMPVTGTVSKREKEPIPSHGGTEKGNAQTASIFYGGLTLKEAILSILTAVRAWFLN